MHRSMNGFNELSIAGRVATPADSDWDAARAAWNLAADQNPVAVAFAESADDVAKVVSFAGRNDLKVAGQGTGHGAVALGPLDDTILLKTERMREVEVDAGSRTATIAAGVLVEELGAAAQAHGMCSMPGSSPNVGIVGYTLGGGLSWLGRRYGFACNRVNAIDVVTADGEQRRIDPDNEPDLFWALRGGGGGYAIVTGLHVSLLPISELYAGALVFPAELGADALRPVPATAADSRRAGASPRPAAPDLRCRVHRQPGGGRGDDRAAAGAGRADHGHLRPDPGGGPLADPHGPRAARARDGPLPAPLGAARRRH